METCQPRLSASVLGELGSICGKEHVSVREPDRILYARDMWPRSLLRQQRGFVEYPPDCVVWPANAEEVAGVVRLAASAFIPIIAFGGGSGVCGGTLPVRGGIVLDLKRLCRILQFEPEDCLLEVESGAIGENLERELERRGWTLGHFPSSIYCSTVGGWIAGRGAGQCSSRYGKIEDMVRALAFVDQEGELQRTPLQLAAYQPWSLDPWLVGSEGTLGVIVAASLFMRPLSARRWYRGFVFSDVPTGVEAMRQILRCGLRPSVLRLYDEFDTLMAAKSGPVDEPVEEMVQERLGALSSPLFKSFRDRSLRTLVMAAGVMNRLVRLLPKECLLVVVQEGEPEEIACAASLLPAICQKKGARDLGEGPGRHWWTQRYAVSYKQSWLFQAGLFVDTMEVATTWDRLLPLYQAVRRAVSPLAFVMAHFSHAYRDGCSIYFSFAAASRKAEAAPALYDRIWEAAQSACLAQGAAVSHHHGVGFSKQRFLVQQLGEAGVLAAAVKQVMDPHGVFNPAKLGQREMRGLP